jgi:hypothetical protein
MPSVRVGSYRPDFLHQLIPNDLRATGSTMFPVRRHKRVQLLLQLGS